MFSGNSGPSLADIAAVTGGRNNDGWGEGGALWVLIILIALLGNGENGLFGNRGNGNNGGGNGANFIPYQVGSSYTDSAIQRGFDNQAVISKLDGITNGLSDGFYAMNTGLMNGFNGVDRAICDVGYQTQNGFNTTNITIMQMQNALQALISQCCCENREGQAQIRYDMATQACDTRQTVQNSARDIIDNANANNRAILDFLVNDKIATLTAENQSLKFAASQTAQNQFITQVGSDIVNRLQPVPVPAFPASNLYAYGNGSGCGCNSCC